MSDISHDVARRQIQATYLDDQEKLTLRQHLAVCADCRTYAAMHAQLLAQLPQASARQRPTPAQRDAVLSAARRSQPRIVLPRRLTSLAGLAALMLLAVGGWLLIRAGVSREPQPAAETWPTFVPRLFSTDISPAATLPAAADSPPTPTAAPSATPDPRGRYELVTVPAPSLAGNAIGEPTEQQVIVYLPPSYDQSNRRYPVVYALVTSESVRAWRTTDELGALAGTIAKQAMTLAMRAGGQEMIIVIPAIGNSLGLRNYFVNSPVLGNWEDYLVSDLVAFVDSAYRTLPAKESRALFAEHDLGLGALSIAARHADKYGAVSVLQPEVFYPGYTITDSGILSFMANSLVLDLIADAKTWPPNEGVTRLRERLPLTEFVPTALSGALAYGMAFAPNLEAGAPYFDYPYAEPSGQPDAAVLQRWEGGFGSVTAKLQPYARELGTLHISIDYYEDVAAYNSAGARYLSEQLSSLGVAHETRAHSLFQPSTTAVLGTNILPALSDVLTSE